MGKAGDPGFARGDSLLCVYNLSPEAREIAVEGVGAITGPSVAAELAQGKLKLGPNAAVWLTVTGAVRLSA